MNAHNPKDFENTTASKSSNVGLAPTLTHEQLEEALEERVNPDRRVKTKERPDAIVERRQADRRSTA